LLRPNGFGEGESWKANGMLGSTETTRKKPGKENPGLI